VKVNETNDGYGQYKVIYEGLNVKFCYRDTSGEYVQLGNPITLPEGSKVCVGVYSPVNQYIGGECCTVSLRNCVLTAKNDETIDYLVGENISLVKEFTVKVATFNICKAEYGATKYKDYTKIVAAIKASGADIIGLQEIEYKTKRTGYVDQTAEIARLAGYPYYKFYEAFDFNEGASGLAVISKYPIENSDQINLPASGAAQRILARAGIRVHNELINFFVTHLSYNGEPGTDRAPQFATIANKIANYNKVILVGDFNTDYWPQFNPIVNKGFLLVSKSDSDKTGTYYDETYGYLALDNIVHSKIFTASGRNFIDNGASDHRLLYATLTYRE
jgi:endonuclease/exonuclease/phosphatase family metal-dependent hydrolase